MEAVNHPAHYNIPGRKECIVEMLERFGSEKVQAFCELNAYKYKYRHDLKNGQEDLDKAAWYEAKQSELEFTDRRFQIANHYGLEGQKNQLIEEMAELTQAICKMNRVHGCGQPVADNLKIRDLEHNLVEELADVRLVLNQVIFLLGCDQEVQEIENQKIDKAERIGRLLEEDKPEGGERNISLEDQFSKPKLSIWYSGQEDPVTIKNTDIDPEVKKDQSGNSYMTITVHDNDGKDQNHKLPLAEVQYMEWRRERLNDKRS